MLDFILMKFFILHLHSTFLMGFKFDFVNLKTFSTKADLILALYHIFICFLSCISSSDVWCLACVW